MLVVFARALLLYLIVIIVMRFMGKRQIGQLQPFELAIAIMISELAAVPMQDPGIPLINGLIPIFTLLITQLLMSLISLKSIKVRTLISGKPSILIENGKINETELRREMYTINDLLEQLRIEGISNVNDVEYAILETNGQLSVLQKSQKRPVCPEDLKIPTDYEGLTLEMVIDGKIIYKNLEKVNQTESWLRNEIKKQGIPDVNDVFFASLDTQGKLFCQAKQNPGKS